MTDQPKTPFLISDDHPIILIGNGEWARDDIEAVANLGPIVAVDGGYYGCQAAGIKPNMIIGDMDSLNLNDLTPDEMPTRHHITDQNSTDLEKALRGTKAPLFIALGFLGKRMDHSLATLAILAQYCDSHNVILLGRHDLIYVTKQNFTMNGQKDKRLSIFPIGAVTFTASVGLVWSLEGLTLKPDGQIGTSNRMTGEKITLNTIPHNKGAYAIITGRTSLDDLYETIGAKLLGQNYRGMPDLKTLKPHK